MYNSIAIRQRIDSISRRHYQKIIKKVWNYQFRNMYIIIAYFMQINLVKSHTLDPKLWFLFFPPFYFDKIILFSIPSFTLVQLFPLKRIFFRIYWFIWYLRHMVRFWESYNYLWEEKNNIIIFFSFFLFSQIDRMSMMTNYF